MLRFENDYCEVAHPDILKKLTEINYEKTVGYGCDGYCASAADRIRDAFGCKDAYVYFLTGGTQTNALVIDAMLKPYEGVLCAETGHINCHEAGAVEYTGHKVLTLPHEQGKINADDIAAYYDGFYADSSYDHMVAPGMVYISQPTEYGTLYTKGELTAISEVCRAKGLVLYLDGARLGYGLTAPGNDVAPEDIARLCDVFYVGGTKVGAMYGEAVVFSGIKAPSQFATRVKQHGAMLAKGWIVGVQFDVLFSDNRYFDIAKNANDRAAELRKILQSKGYRTFMETTTNQIFVIINNDKLREISKSVAVSVWEKHGDGETVVRFCTTWATTKEQIAALASLI